MPVVSLCCFAFALVTPCRAEDLPRGFVYLSDVDETIVEDIRYASDNNFVGRPLDGYQAPRCILINKAARALGFLQTELAKTSLTLVVLDCFRPARAVANIVTFASQNDRINQEYHPNLKTSQLLSEGYIAAKSGHSSGGSVDLTIASLANGKVVLLDMGTGFDFFDPLSHSNSTAVSETAQLNRRYLITLMDRAGFSNYRKEWWHFRFRNEPFKGAIFDFPVVE